MSDILKRAQLVNRAIFDPENPEHVLSFAVFLRTGNWGSVQFYPEIPFIEVPQTVMIKFCRHALKVDIESGVERAERLASKNVVPFPKQLSVSEMQEEGKAAMARGNALVDLKRKRR